MTTFKQINRLAVIALLALILTACSSEDTPESGAGADVAVIAGDPIDLRAPVTGGEAVSCTWTITQAARAKDKDLELSRECDYTIPGDFTAERTGGWAVTVTVEDDAGQVATDTVSIFVSPDTVNNLVLGYFVIFAIGALFVGRMVWRMRELRRQTALLAALAEEAEE